MGEGGVGERKGKGRGEGGEREEKKGERNGSGRGVLWMKEGGVIVASGMVSEWMKQMSEWMRGSNL